MNRKHTTEHIPLRLSAALALPTLFALLYLVAIRPAQLHWGATTEEIARSMPGDELVPAPSFLATRAITIEANPQTIWPWIAQMGYRRAGFYGYDLIENIGSEKGIRSADKIIPGLQNPKTGDELPISGVDSMYFGQVAPESYLIWRGRATPSDGSFAWALYPIDTNHTRLVCRARLHYHWASLGLLSLDLFTEFTDHVAVPKILTGIKTRVEGHPPQSLAAEAAEVLVWVLLLAEFTAAVFLIFRRRRWSRAWLLALAAGLSLLFALYAHAPYWIGALLAAGTLAGLVLSSRADAGSPMIDRPV